MYGGYTLSKKNTLVYEWKIHNITSRMEYKEDQTPVTLTSTNFSIRAKVENQWNIDLYLNNGNPIDEGKDKDALSVYVWNLEENNVKAFVTIYILNNKQEKSNIWQFGQHLFEDGKSWGYNDFVKKERLLDKKYELIPNDILTICTEITVIDENIQIPVKGSYHYSNYQLVEDFKELYKTRAFSDMVINVGEEKLQAHRIILMTRSPVLASMFNQEMSEKKLNEVVITDISSDTFEKLLEYIYTDEVSDLEEDAAELLEAADKYQLASLKKRCEESLCESLNPENALKMLGLADRFSAPYLMEYVIKCITADAAKIVESEEFKAYEKSNSCLGLKLFKELAVASTCSEAGIKHSTL